MVKLRREDLNAWSKCYESISSKVGDFLFTDEVQITPFNCVDTAYCYYV